MSNLRPLLRRLASARSRSEPVPQTEAPYYSRFGGLWTDRTNAPSEIERKLDRGEIKDSEAELLQQWCRQGYVILRQAVEPSVCDQVRTDIERAWRSGDTRLFMFPPGSQQPTPLMPGAPTDRMR